VNVGIVGAGPAGSLLARELALGGVRVRIFDASHPREKPCGGGLTAKALALLPPSPRGDLLRARRVQACRFESGTGAFVNVPLPFPVAVAARRELDAWLLRRAVEAGAEHVAERVVEVDGNGRVRTTSGRDERFECVVGADGAGSLVRRTFLAPTPPARLMMAAGWFAPGTAEMTVRFLPGIEGYAWLFPRPDHVGVGICAPLASPPTRVLLDRLEQEARRAFPALVPDGNSRYAHTIPSPCDERSMLECAGERWALVGDAAGLADPITGEGIYYALRSARLLAATLLEDGAPSGYPARCLEDFGRELLRAAAIRGRFYVPGFAGRMIRYSARSRAVRTVLADLVLGEQGYLGLKRRLLRALPRLALDSALGALGLSAGSGARP